jgi:hypothetical protein
MSKKHLSALALASLLAIPAIAAAEDKKLGCDDVNWSPDVTDMFPQAREACQGITLKDDMVYAKFSAKVVDASKDAVTVEFLDRKDKPVSRVKFAPPEGGTVLLRDSAGTGGTKTPYSKLEKGSVLSFYVPHNRWGLYATPGEPAMKIISREAL